MTYSDELKRAGGRRARRGPGRARRGLGAGRDGDGDRRSGTDRGRSRGVGDRDRRAGRGIAVQAGRADLCRRRRRSGAAVQRHVWTGDRAENKRRSAAAALELLLERVEAQAAVPPDEASGTTSTIPSRPRTPHDLRIRAGRARDSSPSGGHGRSETAERIHVVGAAGAGASAAALLAAHAGAIVDRLRSGRALAVHAGPRRTGDRDRSGTFRCPRDGPSPPGSPGRHQGADRDRSGPARARRRARCRHPGRGMAAGRRRRGRRPDPRRRGRHARQEHDVGLAGPCPGRRGRRPIGVRRARCCRRRSPAARRPRLDGGVATRSSSRPTSTPATSMPTIPRWRS